MRKRLICTLAALGLFAVVAATAGAAARYVAVSGFSEQPVAGAPSITYVLRTSYLAPEKWKAAKAARDATTRRFGPVGSCRFQITVTARSIADADEPAAKRVARLLPAGGRYLRDEGTRNASAWRVIRATGSDKTTGMLVRPAPSVRTQPQGRRVWLELRAVGRPDPKTECHSGGPRSVAASFGTMLATGALGGFQPDRRPGPQGPPPPG